MLNSLYDKFILNSHQENTKLFNVDNLNNIKNVLIKNNIDDEIRLPDSVIVKDSKNYLYNYI